MHDPHTLAFEIRFENPFRKRKSCSKIGYPILSIWHVDPEKNTLGTRADDSCGWFAPPYLQEEADAIKKMAKDQYPYLFSYTHAVREGKSYASVCYDQDIMGTLIYLWRAMTSIKKKKVYQYGDMPSLKELNYLFSLATNPVDNFQSNFAAIKDEKSFIDFAMLLWRCHRRFYRPWYKHPRWHIHHWQIVFHPTRNLYRRFFMKCSVCGKRGFKSPPMANWNGDTHWHQECDRYTQKVKAL